jgi:hypothetical protein
MDNIDRYTHYYFDQLSFYPNVWLYGLCLGNVFLLWQHDGGSFIWGQKEYPIPYAWKKLIAYIVIVVLLFFIHKGITHFWPNKWFSLTVAGLLTGLYLWFVGQVEKKELPQLPVIGKYFK